MSNNQEGHSNFCAQCEALSRELKAIKQEQGEPVAWGVHDQIALNKTLSENLQQRPWVGLTDEEREEIAEDYGLEWLAYRSAFREIETKLKEKNT